MDDPMFKQKETFVRLFGDSRRMGHVYPSLEASYRTWEINANNFH